MIHNLHIKSQRIQILVMCLTFFFTIQSSAQQIVHQNKISIVSWNIRDFGKTKSDTIINAIATIIQNHDIVAIQEVVAGYGGSQAVARLADALNRKGSSWDYSISSPTKSPPYKTEKYAYLWKTSKVSISKKTRLLTELNPKVFREPFLIAFKIGTKNIKILNYHSRKHNDKPEEEISAIIKYLNSNNQTLILGDFNISETNQIWDNLYKNNYNAALKNSPTTLKINCKNGNYLNHAIDNIYYPTTKISLLNSGVLDIVKNCNQLKNIRAISDHLPVFVEINIH